MLHYKTGTWNSCLKVGGSLYFVDIGSGNCLKLEGVVNLYTHLSNKKYFNPCNTPPNVNNTGYLYDDSIIYFYVYLIEVFIILLGNRK